MPQHRQSQAQEIYLASLSSHADNREHYIEQACGADRDLLQAVRLLQAQGEAPTEFLAQPSPLIGQQLNSYSLLSFLGAGGMGEVYRAHDSTLGRDVALKLLPSAFAQDAARLERFQREARLLASLSHPNIAAIYGLEESNDTHFLVLELVPGETLADYIGNNAGSLRNSFHICAQIAEALNAAHKNGVIHRDIKPANVKITPDGCVKVLDFGLAKAIPTASFAPKAMAETEVGRVFGTPAYMSPEQVRGEPADTRSDIWAFGCLAYELLCRKGPFAYANLGETFAAILRADPDWKCIPPETPRSIVDLLRSCLQKDPKRRPDTLDTLRQLMLHAAAPQVIQPWLPRRFAAVTGMLLLALAIASGAIPYLRRWYSGLSGSHVRSLAVLPFTNTGGDPDWDYLADGVTESMINRLSRISDLTVMSRSAVFKAKKSAADPIEQGRRMHVDAILTGSIRHFPDHLEASVELVDCATGRHLWGEHYRQVFLDSLAFEKNAVEDTVTQLRVRLDTKEKQSVTRNYTSSLETYRLYLKGRYEWNKRNFKAYERAILYFKKALDLDPSYALAYAGIADAYSFENGRRPASEVFPKAQEAARKAIELDPDMPEAHASLGFIYLQYVWDWGKAETEFRLALRGNPNYASAHSMYAKLLTALGRFPEAETEIGKAETLDPLSTGIASGVAFEYYLARDYGRAEKQFRDLLALDSNPVNADLLALTLAANSRAAEAVGLLEKIIAADPSDLSTMADLVRAYCLAGRAKDGSALMEKISNAPNLKTLLPTSLAEALGSLGRLDQAFAELDRAFSEKCWYLIFLNVEPIFDPLRQDPRFRTMQRKMVLAG